jgi:hypothetical protein
LKDIRRNSAPAIRRDEDDVAIDGVIEDTFEIGGWFIPTVERSWMKIFIQCKSLALRDKLAAITEH